MQYAEILKQAWRTAWRYRALWVLGIVLALTTSSFSVPLWSGSRNDQDNGGRLVYVLPDDSRIIIPGGPEDESEGGGDVILNYKHQADDWPFRQGDAVINYNPPNEFSVGVVSKDRTGNLDLETLEIQPWTVGTVLALGVGLLLLIALLFVVSRVARYVAETALIRLVDECQETGEKRGVWQGVRMGWSRSAWRLFLIDLLVDTMGVLAGLLLFAAILAPLPLWVQGREAVIFALAFLTGSLFFLAIAVVIVGSAVLSLLKRFARRASALDDLGVLAAIGRGYGIVRGHLKDAGLTWLITVAVRWGWTLALVPIVLGLVGVALLTGSLPALLTGGLASLATSSDLPVFLALGVGIPIFIVVLVVPLIILGAVREVFLSALWTLSYRELRPLSGQIVRSRSGLDEPGLEAAPAAA